MSWRVGPDELVLDTKLCGGGLKWGWHIPLTIGEAIGKLEAVVYLYTLHPDAPASIPLEQLFEEIGRRVGALLRAAGTAPSRQVIVSQLNFNRSGRILHPFLFLCPTCIVRLHFSSGKNSPSP